MRIVIQELFWHSGPEAVPQKQNKLIDEMFESTFDETFESAFDETFKSAFAKASLFCF